MENKKKTKTVRNSDITDRMIEEMLLKHKEESEEFERKRKAEEAAHTEAIRSYFSGGLNRLRPQASKTKTAETDIDDTSMNIIGEDNDVSDSYETTNAEEPKKLKSDEKETDSNDTIVIDVTQIDEVTKMIEVAQDIPVPNQGGSAPKEKLLTTKVSRISAKMRRASRVEFHDTYLIKTDTKGGKPITIAQDLIERAYRICIRSGDYKACPTYLFNNLLREALDLIEPDTESWATLD